MPDKIEKIKALCPKCKGSGFTSKAREKFCDSCEGSGTVLADAGEVEDCKNCEGEGHTDSGHCPKCCGTGKIVKAK